VLALDLPIAAVLTVAVVGGFATGLINPILSDLAPLREQCGLVCSGG
jgi:hypothetical protein